MSREQDTRDPRSADARQACGKAARAQAAPQGASAQLAPTPGQRCRRLACRGRPGSVLTCCMAVVGAVRGVDERGAVASRRSAYAVGSLCAARRRIAACRVRPRFNAHSPDHRRLNSLGARRGTAVGTSSEFRPTLARAFQGAVRRRGPPAWRMPPRCAPRRAVRSLRRLRVTPFAFPALPAGLTPRPRRLTAPPRSRTRRLSSRTGRCRC